MNASFQSLSFLPRLLTCSVAAFLILTTIARAESLLPMHREILITPPYLRFPVHLGGEVRQVSFSVDGKIVRMEAIRLADGTPDFWGGLNVEAFQGKTVTISATLPQGSQGLAAIAPADTISEGKDLYHEALRSQFHFSPRLGWTNDPNGMVYENGEYHLSFQHNPLDLQGPGFNMHWGHAVSADMVHWREQPDIFYPDAQGNNIWSGSIVVDKGNTAGMQQGPNPVLAAFYTLAGPFTQILSFSSDHGRSWVPWEGNPVVPKLADGNRDPKVIWYEPGREWVMVLFLSGHDFALLTSPDLKNWTKQQVLSFPALPSPSSQFAECPDFFPLTVEGEPTQKWIFTCASTRYVIGDFDGRTFTPDKQDGQLMVMGSQFYATQTFSDTPDGRRIEMAWIAGGSFSGMPFSEQLSFPAVLTLHRYPEGLSLKRMPIAEIASLHGQDHPLHETIVQPGQNPLSGLKDELYDISAEFEVPASGEFGFKVRGTQVSYSVNDKTFAVNGGWRTPLPPENGQIRIRLLVDRACVEVYANDGRASCAYVLEKTNQGLPIELFTTTSPLHVISLHAYDLHSIWP